ncbi:polysaccharide deacetylase family protein [Pseudomonas sp. S1Bt30]|uniref:Polysaccharide deacetylase family protein n=1 Tax=Pseudomonas quebecensis TaxID=2995174 RepID=A0ABY6QDR7_9PSED|nr:MULTISPECIES: polysaccharide deacetylase family protein [Pseudomonas]MCX4065943.1 polysaccharide deacetylase family protein [Pseudomonas quebecensis]UZW17541.1 polysaccharide deacetylase family protein [Pseudomonas quebecensis]UZW25044.1 polysaccharide deacetylase family protein [Pseudomonas quebecensis]UZW30107.1 polysaccharide deacetylase family protein [Pseudomonas quebecensis]
MRIALLLSAGLLCMSAQAASVDVASLDRGTWPEKLTSPALFDVGSRAEILMFAHSLLASETQDDAALKQRLGLKIINLAAINDLRRELWRRLLENYSVAQQSCEVDASFCYLVENMDDLREEAGKFEVSANSFYIDWAAPSHAFHERYLDELLRKAALFPQIGSEVARFGEHERNGDEFNDRLFLLTFDGGPAPVTGNTDWLADYLRKQKMNGIFFVLGSSLQTRLERSSAADVQALYQGQCVGTQGWQYRSHSHWVDWQSSITRSAALAQNLMPENYVPLFRPPYGQRRADSQGFFQSQGLQVALWDIDSQDEPGRLKAQESAQRVLTLMLLWRKGVIVFHDTQDKARVALPWLLQATAQSGLGWQDCREAF